MDTAFLVVFGLGLDFVALGVTETVTRHVPAFRPFTAVPESLQIFFDDVATTKALAPLGSLTSREQVLCRAHLRVPDERA